MLEFYLTGYTVLD